MSRDRPAPATRLETWCVLLLATSASIAAFVYYFRRGQILLYGDAVAHMAIARRIFDSLTPGLSQLGSVWLPLPHLLMAPFVYSDDLWQNGIGGSIPSMVAYCAATVGIFRLVRCGLAYARVGSGTAILASWF